LTISYPWYKVIFPATIKNGNIMNKLRDTPVVQILNSEQQILLRTDQKAYTLLSILGVFMVFFLVHYIRIPVNWITLSLLAFYFLSAYFTIFCLVKTVIPRISTAPNPTFFEGIRQFKDAQDYYDYIKEVNENYDEMLRLFSLQTHALAEINHKKNYYLKRGVIFFIAAITFELTIVLITFFKLGLLYILNS